MAPDPALYVAAMILAGAAGGFAGPAQAGDGLREALFGQRPHDGRRIGGPPSARYVSENGEGFVLDRTADTALLKFDSSVEVWALQPHPGPRGDVIYKNDMGEPVLRATRLGGLTVFTDQRPGGSAAALAGGVSPLHLAPISASGLLQRLAQASAKASSAARHLISFEADATAQSSPLVADAAMITAEALAGLARRSGHGALGRVKKVSIVEGRKPDAALQKGGVRVIVINPANGLAGRPSSERIAHAITGR